MTTTETAPQQRQYTEVRYDAVAIDRKWQERWERDGIYRVSDDDPRPKWFEMTMYPYPSGDLHIGHWYAMAPSDAHARFRRMQGYNVLHPIGFDAFGLPAENAAISRGIHPYEWTMSNVDNMRRQLRSIGAIYDWDREVVCCLPEYYRWNQWFFIKLYEKGLAYRAKAPVVWCTSCQTVLANEQVLNGVCERCDAPITRRDFEQWFFRITDYADELLDFSGLADWPDKILTMQRNWIGRSEGVEITFDISEHGLETREIRTFTTRIDTIFGVTFLALAPEHPMVTELTSDSRREEVNAYIERARAASEIDRLSTDQEKTGVFTGAYARNRLNDERVPIYIADYVLTTYGTGAVMGVPAHDARDFDFARKYRLPIRTVIAPIEWDGSPPAAAYVGPGFMTNSGAYDGMTDAEGITAIADDVERRGWGRRAVTYRLRDWLISRQRYWGTPIPMVYCDRCGVQPAPESELPVLLPADAEFRPTGESPLAINDAFVNASCPRCGGPGRRETDTMDTFMDSSWYMLRYCSPRYQDGPFEPQAAAEWMPVRQYTGGAEHAVMHLLYSRFFIKSLRDLGMLQIDEPFLRLFNQGVILGQDHEKMSKSRGNVVNPDDVVGQVGADAVRCFLMFIGPWDQGGPWSDEGSNGVVRWLNRVWSLAGYDAGELDAHPAHADAVRATQRVLHQTIRKCHDDLDKFKFNTAIAALMELANHLSRVWNDRANDHSVDAATWRECVSTMLLLLAPLAPHLAEELWERAGHGYSIHQQAFPAWDDALAAEEEITLVAQVNGRLRDRLNVPADISEADAKAAALGSPRVLAHIEGKPVRNVVYVPGRLVNVVAG